MSRKIKSVLVAGIILLSIGLASFAYYQFVLRRISVTFDEDGLPSGTNWSVTMLNLNNQQYRQESTAYSNSSSITFGGVIPNGIYTFRVVPALAYVAFYKSQPITFANISTYPHWFVLNTPPNSAIEHIAFKPFYFVDNYSIRYVLNNTTYKSQLGIGFVANSSVSSWGLGFVFYTAIKNSNSSSPYGVMTLNPVNGTSVNYSQVVHLFGSYTISAVSIRTGSADLYQLVINTNGTGFNINNTSPALPWIMTPTASNLHYTYVNLTTPDFPATDWVLFTFTITDWNPNAQ